MPKNYKQFMISDTHFGHKNIIKFTNKKGERIRPFDSVEQINYTPIALEEILDEQGII